MYYRTEDEERGYDYYNGLPESGSSRSRASHHLQSSIQPRKHHNHRMSSTHNHQQQPMALASAPWPAPARRPPPPPPSEKSDYHSAAATGPPPPLPPAALMSAAEPQQFLQSAGASLARNIMKRRPRRGRYDVPQIGKRHLQISLCQPAVQE